MRDLTRVYEAYGDFETNAYYSICFNTVPSIMKLDLPLKVSKKNMEDVLASIDLDRLKLKPVYKNWKTHASRDAASSKDFPYEYLYKSEEHKLLCMVSLEYNELMIKFLYDLAEEGVEEELHVINDLLRARFGEEHSPVFKVLSRNSAGFHTEDVKTRNFDLNIEELYNDDFKEVDSLIVNSMERDSSGLILLHGKPGTGKSSYIKYLVSEFKEKSFIFIQNEFINQLLLPDFISFLLLNKDSVLIIEDAEKVITSREYTNEASVVSTILQLTDGLFSDYLNIKIICTFNTSIERIDKALLRKGRIIANYEFGALAEEKTEQLLLSLGHEPMRKKMVLADIFNYHQQHVEETPSSDSKIGF